MFWYIILRRMHPKLPPTDEVYSNSYFFGHIQLILVFQNCNLLMSTQKLQTNQVDKENQKFQLKTCHLKKRLVRVT